jgi:hypothetical protein
MFLFLPDQELEHHRLCKILQYSGCEWKPILQARMAIPVEDGIFPAAIRSRLSPHCLSMAAMHLLL